MYHVLVTKNVFFFEFLKYPTNNIEICFLLQTNVYVHLCMCFHCCNYLMQCICMYVYLYIFVAMELTANYIHVDAYFTHM